tara:strand:- start:1157 stop:2539 length:1383 start_codon:yes stop_codon:yes gene_type:complete
MDQFFQQPLSYYLCLIVVALLSVEVSLRPNTPWRMPFLTVLGTIAVWYLIEPVYFPEEFLQFRYGDVRDIFICVLIFFVAFRIFVGLAMSHVKEDRSSSPDLWRGELGTIGERLLIYAFGLWVVLLGIGTMRMGGDILAALFPDGRTDAGSMWARNAIETGASGSLLAVANYLYVLTISSFGVLLVLIQRPHLKFICLLLVIVAWPYAFLFGARNIALAAIGPGFLAFVLYSKSRPVTKAIVAIVAFTIVDFLFRIIVEYRNLGFDQIAAGGLDISQTRHFGLNMASELGHILTFMRNGTLHLQWGGGYLLELSQFIPRAIWPDKPTLNLEYSIARGFNQMGVINISVTQGMIGQGVRNFGFIGGPLFVAFLMTIWVKVLTSLREAKSVARTFLYLIGLGLTFNIGREVSLLVLWPFVFGYVSVKAYEIVSGTKTSPAIGSARTSAADRRQKLLAMDRRR